MSANTDDALLTLYREMSGKLDKLIEGQAVLNSRVGTVETRVVSTEAQVSELYSTVRGFNGTAGLVTEVALLKNTVQRFFADLQKIESPHEDKPQEEDEEEHKQFISWEWVVDKVTMPMVTAIVLWFLLTILPQLIAHIGVVK